MAITGPLERAIMEALWDSDRPLVIRELMHCVNEGASKPSAYTTVQTVADRLVIKGLLSRTLERNAYRYEPTRTREDHVAEVMLDALSGVDDRGPALARFVDAMDPQDVHRLLVELAQRSAPHKER